jgi:hypothetical protein
MENVTVNQVALRAKLKKGLAEGAILSQFADAGLPQLSDGKDSFL